MVSCLLIFNRIREREEAEGDQLQEPTAEHLVQYKAGVSSGACELKIGIN